jgi:hypothetical protein
MKRQSFKVLCLLLLLGLFYALGGFAVPRGASESPIFDKHNPVIPWLLIMGCFLYGACIMLWGDKTAGVIHPISFRPAYIAVGALLMLLAVLFTSCARFAGNHRTHGSAAVNCLASFSSAATNSPALRGTIAQL